MSKLIWCAAVLSTTILSAGGARLESQERPSVPRPAPRTAGIAPAPATSTAPVSGAATRAGPVALPALVGNDGRIFADFGFGYEQILRACAAPATGTPANQSAGAAPSYLPQPFTPPTYTAPTYTPPNYQPPAPRGATASSAAGIAPPPAPAPAVAVSDRARAACWTTNELGRVVVIR